MPVTFCLDTKSNQKIKTKGMLPRSWPYSRLTPFVGGGLARWVEVENVLDFLILNSCFSLIAVRSIIPNSVFDIRLRFY